MKPIKYIVSLLLIVVVFGFSGCETKDENETFHGFVFPVEVYDNIIVEEATTYSGEFPEDGTFSEKENILSLKISNNSEKDLRLIRIYVTTSKKEMFFEVTTLTAKSYATVFEKNAQILEDDEEIIEFRAENIVYFDNSISLKGDKVEITPLKSVFNVKNISGEDISSDIYIYYKRIDENGDYFGGITFRSKASGLKDGELKQIPASHFDTQNSKVIFVDYAE